MKNDEKTEGKPVSATNDLQQGSTKPQLCSFAVSHVESNFTGALHMQQGDIEQVTYFKNGTPVGKAATSRGTPSESAGGK